VQDVGPGTLIANRYAVSHRIQHHPRWDRWAAQDTRLGTEVVVLTFPGGTATAAAAIDAAHRVAGVAEPRLVRVLDVIAPPPDTPSPTFAAVVEEPAEHARTLTRILEQGGLPGEEARRIAGETAKALAAAAARGLRHVVLTPRNVLLLPGGAVRVRGLAVEAALLGLEDTPGAVASRLDATALVGIGYAALTGRWPLTGADSGLPKAPRVGGSVVAPDELAADVCPDLDRLVRTTLVEGAGPITAAEVVASLRPWPSTPSIDVWAERSPMPVVGVAPLAPEGAAGTTPGDPLPPVAPALPPTPSAAGDLPNTFAGQPDSPKDGSSTGRGAAALTAGVSAAASATGAALGKGARRLGEVLSSAGGAAAEAAVRLSERTRHTLDRGDPRDPADPGDLGVPGDPAGLTGPTRPGPTDTLVPVRGEIGRPESRLALAIVAALVVLLAIIGIWGVKQIGSSSGPRALPGVSIPRASALSGTATATAPAGAAPSAAPTAQPTTIPSALTPVAIVGAAGFDSTGGQVPSGTAARAYDGKPDTMWRSGWYTTETFGGLKIPGIGLAVDLGQPTQVRRVAVTVPVAQDFTVYLGTRASIDGATLIGSSSGGTGQVVFDVPAGPVPSGNIVIIFMTKLGPDGDGKFRAQVSEVVVSR